MIQLDYLMNTKYGFPGETNIKGNFSKITTRFMY